MTWCFLAALKHARGPDEHDEADAEVEAEGKTIEDSAEEEPLSCHHALLPRPAVIRFGAQLHLVALRCSWPQPPLPRRLQKEAILSERGTEGKDRGSGGNGEANVIRGTKESKEEGKGEYMRVWNDMTEGQCEGKAAMSEGIKMV